ncbi:receptor-like protein kinase FERONIA [Cornus florida]|uniref:receptor-like protein kinase FERONIA n=1 Tax=Cornus florida TaxID=4283 RepID=UPI00289E401B|nr:receptor-like protein kinase FERONIA [Cornus florida]
MYLFHLRIIISVYLVHHLLFTGGTGDSHVHYYSVDDIAINCGSAGSSSGFDGREWIGDIGSTFTSPKEAKPISISSSTTVHQSPFADSIPYMTARISRAQFTYTFRLSPGQKFIRLHFYPASYTGFARSKALFHVKAGPFTLLNNFSPSLTADAFGVSYFAKEFCVNLEENQVFNITISPSKSTSSSNDDDVYAFINGIEIVSMPTGLYYTPDGHLGAYMVGNKFRFGIDNGTALEMVYRLNVGGRSILSVEDLGMFRMWYEDKKYLLQSSLLRVTTSKMITYTSIPTYIAPSKVYQTAWSVNSNQQTNQAYNFTWKLPVDLGFRYLVRLHFCELEPMITHGSQKQFDLLMNNKVVENDANAINWSGGNGVAIYRDYAVVMEGDRMESQRDLIITLQLKYVSSTKRIEATLKGIEIFKLTNPDNNLASSANNVSTTHASIPRIPKLRRLVLAFGSINVIGTGAILILTLLNFIVYHLSLSESKSSKINNSSSLDEKELHRRFSLVEIQFATNNFDDGLIIGKGGFGNVYQGMIDRTRCVAIKRLNPQSKQGAHEFWAEINVLSELRHNHLVSLIGYCDDCREMILVYEYMTHGTLADHLHKASRNGSGDSPLSWEQRLNICIGAARGLDFLHTSSGGHHGIIHRDVKSSNILLDENWVAKISDFGLSKMDTANASRTHISTNVKGTFGYLDPKYFMTRRLTKKSDVYAFGVVLFEVLCGRRAVDLTLADEQHSLAIWAPKCIRKGTIDQVVDPSVKEQISGRCLRRFVEIANKCLHDQPNERPTMAEIVARLDLIILELHRRDNSYTEQEIIDVGGTCNEHVEESISSEDSSLTSRHYSLPPKRGVVSLRILNSTNKRITFTDHGQGGGFGTCFGIEDHFQCQNGPWSGWRFWDSLWHRRRPSLPKVNCHRFSLAKIEAATNNFSDCFLIGKGGFRTVYVGSIQDLKKVAISRWNKKINAAYDSFCRELEVQSQLRCINIVPLVGYCYDGDEMILVHEYMVNGSLSDHLHNTSNNNQCLSWKQRLQICIGVAQGLNYLHRCVEQTIVHLDIKPSNIFLDQNWVAKISDFELSKLAPKGGSLSTSRICGTYGYMAPEYAMRGQVSGKSDVFSFGIMVLEVLSGRKVNSHTDSTDFWQDERTPRRRTLRECIKAGSFEQIIDPNLIGNTISPLCLSVFVKIARKCISERETERPQMNDVVHILKHALKLQEIADGALFNEERVEGTNINAYELSDSINHSSSHLQDTDWITPDAPDLQNIELSGPR